MIGRSQRVVLVTALVTACSSSSASVTATPDAASALDAGGEDANRGLETGAPTCTGACQVLTLDVALGGMKRSLARAQLGTKGEQKLRVEAHDGGDASCPTETSPTPSYTLVLTGVPRHAAGGVASLGDGLAASFLDFKGDLGLPPVTKATAVSITGFVEDAASPPAWAAFELKATFAEGTVSGHVYASYCAGLSE